jgi:hypothetical protein
MWLSSQNGLEAPHFKQADMVGSRLEHRAAPNFDAQPALDESARVILVVRQLMQPRSR